MQLPIQREKILWGSNPDGSPIYKEREFVTFEYKYAAFCASIASGATPVTDTMQVETSSDFVWCATTYQLDGADALDNSTFVIPYLTIAVQDGGSSRNLQNRPTPIDNIAGRGQLPYYLKQPLVFTAGSSIQVTFGNYSLAGLAATYTNIFFTMLGYKKIYSS